MKLQISYIFILFWYHFLLVFYSIMKFLSLKKTKNTWMKITQSLDNGHKFAFWTTVSLNQMSPTLSINGRKSNQLEFWLLDFSGTEHLVLHQNCWSHCSLIFSLLVFLAYLTVCLYIHKFMSRWRILLIASRITWLA